MPGLPPIKILGCDPDCEHEWGETTPISLGRNDQDRDTRHTDGRNPATQGLVGCPKQKGTSGQFCQKCGGWRGALGHEPELTMYIGHLVAIYRQVYRVLREDGCVFIVIGDSYSSSGGPEPAQTKWQVEGASDGQAEGKSRKVISSLKQGDLMLVPHRLALALQADGWVIRNDLVFSKKSPMPESVRGQSWQRHRIKVKKSKRATPDVYTGIATSPQSAVRGPARNYDVPQEGTYTDCPGREKCEENGGYVLKRGSWRHTRAHEMVIMCTKKMGYWADGEVAREQCLSGPSDVKKMVEQRNRIGGKNKELEDSFVKASSATNIGKKRAVGSPAGRNPRSVLTTDEPDAIWAYLAEYHPDILESYLEDETNPLDVLTPKPSPFSGKHFAAYPPSLCEPLIKATCPTKCCPECGTGWSPVVEKGLPAQNSSRPQARQAIEIWNESGLNESHLHAIRSVGSTDVGKSQVTQNGYGKNRPEIQRLANEAKEKLGGYYREFLFGENNILGYRPTCGCGMAAYDAVPGVVLDPFGGSGTTALVADRLGLNSILIEISLDYAEMSKVRIEGDAPLLANVEIVK